MGIPFYFKHLIKKHPNILTQQVESQCTNLFFDFNCIIHNSAANIVKTTPALSHNDLHKNVIQDSLSVITTICSQLRPIDLIYVAVDGLCPFSKMHQQRGRRYISEWKKAVVDEKKSENGIILDAWNSNVVTPGTMFMQQFNKELHNFKNILKSKYSANIIISDCNEQGEGEYKIFQYLRNNPSKGTNIVYGLDADLILLSLIQFDHSIYLYRDDFLVNITCLREKINNEYNVKQLPQIRFINDYVMLLSFLGNDFLPSIPFLSIRNNGIDMIMQIYNSLDLYFIDKDGINEIFFKIFVGKLSQLIENTEFLTDSIRNYKNQRFFIETRKNIIEQTISKIDNYPMLNKKDLVDTSLENFKTSYYTNLFHGFTSISDICNEYIKGFIWIHEYYFKGSIYMTWSYPHVYAPLMSDILNTLSTRSDLLADLKVTIDDEEHNIKCPLDTDLQLLLVMPPNSLSLIPKHLHPFINDITYGFTHWFPYEFKISSFLKRYIWECKPCLPIINIHKFTSQFYTKLNTSG